MTEKYAAIQRMKNLMKEHNLKYVFLKQPIYTTHPGYDKPNSDNRPYTINEVYYDAKEDSLRFWQFWSDYNVGMDAQGFEDQKVFLVESALNETLASLKKYEVKVTASTYIMATSPANAIATVQHLSSPDINDAMCCIIPTGEVKEK